MSTMDELLDQYIDQEKLHLEGRRGVKALCQIARALGYKDPQYFGQLSNKAAIGDLICMLEDNSGLMVAMLEWISGQRNAEWVDTIQSQLHSEEEEITD